jgi:hypothetical protein
LSTAAARNVASADGADLSAEADLPVEVELPAEAELPPAGGELSAEVELPPAEAELPAEVGLPPAEADVDLPAEVELPRAVVELPAEFDLPAEVSDFVRSCVADGRTSRAGLADVLSADVLSARAVGTASGLAAALSFGPVSFGASVECIGAPHSAQCHPRSSGPLSTLRDDPKLNLDRQPDLAETRRQDGKDEAANRTYCGNRGQHGEAARRAQRRSAHPSSPVLCHPIAIEERERGLIGQLIEHEKKTGS